MVEIDVPGQRPYRFEHLALDLNGTIALDGNMIQGVPEGLELLRNLVDIIIVTADTWGKAQKFGKGLRIKIHKVDPGDGQVQKLKLVQQLSSETTVSIGNGPNNASTLRESILGECVLVPEGTSSEAIANYDLVMSDINAVLDLLAKPQRLIATFRK